MTTLERMLTSYVDCALWSSSVGEEYAALCALKDGEEYAPDQSLEVAGFIADDVAPEALASMRADCADFLQHADPRAIAYWETELGEYQVGHDFWLTRNGHGAGFWDRFMAEPGAAFGRHLTEQAKPYGSSDLYIGDDGKVYVS